MSEKPHKLRAMDIRTLNQDDLDNVLARMNPQEIDQLAFGAIQLDASGKILFYSQGEGQITGRSAKDVVGKNFFTEVAPCTNTPKFHGAFKAGVAAGKLDTVFEYLFDYNMAPTKVRVHLKTAISGNGYWVIVRRI